MALYCVKVTEIQYDHNSFFYSKMRASLKMQSNTRTEAVIVWRWFGDQLAGRNVLISKLSGSVSRENTPCKNKTTFYNLLLKIFGNTVKICL